MADGPHPGHPGAVLAASLRSRRGDVLAAYDQQLTDEGSPLVSDPQAREQALAHAGEVLDDVLDSLCDAPRGPGHRSVALARNIGVARAAQGVHPGESLRASSALFQVMVSAAEDCLPAGKDTPLLLAVRALHRAISVRLQNASASYYGFLLDKLSAAHEDERQHLARELHDRVSAGLNIAYRQLELQEIAAGRESGAGEHVESARQAVGQAMGDIRQLLFNLRCTEPLENLDTALRDYLDCAADASITAEIRVTGDEPALPAEVRTEVFLVLREALRNALKHGAPAGLGAHVTIARGVLRATVDDDGVGFDPCLASAETGTGLPSMRERVELLGGTFGLSSVPGKGTRVEIMIPLGGAGDGAG